MSLVPIFHVRGDSADCSAYRAGGFKAGSFLNVGGDSGSSDPIGNFADLTSGVLGGRVIKRVEQNRDGISYNGKGNVPTHAMSVMIRILAKWTDSGGFPTNNQSLFVVGACDGFWSEGVGLGYRAVDGKLDLTWRRRMGHSIGGSSTLGAGQALAPGAVHEFLVNWDGTSNASSIKTYINGVLYFTSSPSTGYDGSYASGRKTNGLGIIIGKMGSGFDRSEWWLNEFCIWDQVVDYTMIDFARANYITSTEFEGLANTSPGAANVRSATTWYFNGLLFTGSAVVPTAPNVRLGTLTDAATGTLIVPAVTDVRFPVAVDSASGTCRVPASGDVRFNTLVDVSATGALRVPAASSVRLGTLVDNTTGTAAIPAASDVRFGTAVDAGSGTARIPAATHVRSGTLIDASTGSLAVPAASSVRFGTAVDAGSGTARIPAVTDVRLGVLTDAATGTAAIPTAADVRFGTATDATTGSLRVPSDDDVRSGVLVDASTGNMVMPDEDEVRVGVTFDTDGASTGTYTGNVMTELTLEAQNLPDSETEIVFTIGDSMLMSLRARDAEGEYHDLTGATLVTKFAMANGNELVIANSAHTIDPDQDTNPGKFTVTLTEAQTLKLKPSTAKQSLITKVQQGSDTLQFHGKELIVIENNRVPQV